MLKSFHVCVGVATSLVAAPLVAALALGTWVVLRANPFFVQERVGRDGRVFRLIKLRTLPVHAPAYADKYAIREIDTPAYCRALRKYHLDELPQLFLVAAGRMSLVGPRPEMVFLHEQMPGELASARVRVLPGCTGLWQVSSACAGLIGESPEYDLFYLHHRRLRLDVWILWRTVLKVLGVGRPVTLADVPDWAYVPAIDFDRALVEVGQDVVA